MTEDSSRLVKGPIHEMFPDDWVQDRSVASAWVRFYSILHIPRDEFFDSLEGFLGSEDDRLVNPGDRLLVGFATLEDFSMPRAAPVVFSDHEGTLRVKLDVSKLELPDANYVVLAMLKSDVDVERSEAEVKDRLDAVAAVYCVHCGNGVMWELMWEGEVSLAGGEIRSRGDVWRMPQPVEGPFLAHQNAVDAKEVLESVGKLREPTRSRVRLALQLMNDGMRARHGFFEYWTALEVLVGTTNAIKYALSDTYGVKDVAQFSADIGLTELGKWRKDFFHDGKRPSLSPDVERYMQLLFLDLLRRELELEPRNHLAGLVKARGVDLSPLGLPDRRTDEQKAATERGASGSSTAAADVS